MFFPLKVSQSYGHIHQSYRGGVISILDEAPDRIDVSHQEHDMHILRGFSITTHLSYRLKKLEKQREKDSRDMQNEDLKQDQKRGLISKTRSISMCRISLEPLINFYHI